MKNILLFGLLCVCCQNQSHSGINHPETIAGNIPANVKKLLRSYPGIITGYHNNRIFFYDGSSLIYDDGIKNKSFDQLMNNPDVKDQFAFVYPTKTFIRPATILTREESGMKPSLKKFMEALQNKLLKI